MKNLSLGLKISLGFALLIIIASVLGIMAIWNMGRVETQSTMLANEYVPEVAVANELRGASNRVMYEMRGYGFTEDTAFYDAGMKELAALDAALEKARKLEAASPNLKQLKGQLEIASKAVEEYKTLMKQTVDTTARMAEERNTLDSSAEAYMTNSNAFLAGQNEQFKQDLAARQEKISLVSRLVDIGASARVLNFKSQATNDTALMLSAIETIEKADPVLTQLRQISSDKEDIARIDATEDGAKSYKEGMDRFLIEYNKGSMASVTRLNDIRSDMDKNAQAYVENCDAFLKGQQEKLTQDMLERQTKITLVNDIIDLGNATRINAFKSQALRSPAVMEEAIKNFTQINALFEELKKSPGCRKTSGVLKRLKPPATATKRLWPISSKNGNFYRN